jgi:hypothetical protein
MTGAGRGSRSRFANVRDLDQLDFIRRKFHRNHERPPFSRTAGVECQLHAFQGGLRFILGSQRCRLSAVSRKSRGGAATTAYDRTHIFGAHYVWELPFLNDRSKRALYNLAGGWEITGSTRLSSGVPYHHDAGEHGEFIRRGRHAATRSDRRPGGCASHCGSVLQRDRIPPTAPNQFGNAPRSVICLPYQNVTDLDLFKNFDTGPRVQVQFRAELFNVFNRTSFTNATIVMGNPAFGRLTETAQSRLVQFGIRASL